MTSSLTGPTPRILAIGGAHIDRRGQFSVAFVAGASNPGAMGEDVGGGIFNALRTAVRLGAGGALLSVRGGDAAGETVARAVAAAGVADLSVVFLDRVTPSYTALLDRDGDVVAALADMALYEIAFPKQMRRSKVREAVQDADAIFCDANLPATALQRLMPITAGKPVFAVAISPAKAVRLTGVLPALSCLFMNFREAAALAGLAADAPGAAAIERLRALGLRSGVITRGSQPAVGFDPSGVVSITPPPARRIADVTGAGDALAGAASVALLQGRPFGEAMRHGIAAAMLAMESRAAVPAFTPSAFAEALALVPQAVEMR